MPKIEITYAEVQSLAKDTERVKNQNKKILARLRAVVNNHNYYLKKRLPARKGYHNYEQERIHLLRDFTRTRKSIAALMGRIYIDNEPDGQPKFFVKMSKGKIDKLMGLLK